MLFIYDVEETDGLCCLRPHIDTQENLSTESKGETGRKTWMLRGLHFLPQTVSYDNLNTTEKYQRC
jgi:hypothetical protein